MTFSIARTWIAVLVYLMMVPALFAQPAAPGQPPQGEGAFAAAWRREVETLKHDCSSFDLKALGGCAVSLATEQPLHVSFGTLAPLNGVGFGPALVGHHTPNENWRLNWSTDVVGALSGAWRAGGYLKIIRTAVEPPRPGTGPPSPMAVSIHPYPVIDAYVQTTSLPRLAYYGIGPDTPRGDKTYFGMRQTVIGASAIYPVTGSGAFSRLNLALLGEFNNRLVDLRDSPDSDAPSIEQAFTENTAPGLAPQPGVAQFGEGVRVKPSLLSGWLQLDYLTRFQQFVATDSHYSFQRWTLDLDHAVPLYRDVRSADARDSNTPNHCSIDATVTRCPPVSRNRTGTVDFRIFVSRSDVSGDSVVPFYFQPTLGGSDIDGNRMLASYDDYRFRAPDALLFRQSLEHSIGSWPVGIWLAMDEGRVSVPDAEGSAFRKSFTAGLTLRAGGFPVVLLTWATGDSEGQHVAITITSSLLGGSARPSLR